MSSVMDHPFFALAMSLRPKETTESGGEDAKGGIKPHDILPTTSSDEPKTPHHTKPTITTTAPSSTVKATPRTLQHILDEENWFKCPKCPPSNKLFKSDLALRMHLASGIHQQGSDDGEYPNHKTGGEETEPGSWTCPRCPPDRIFGSALALRMHIASKKHERESGEDNDLSQIAGSEQDGGGSPDQLSQSQQNWGKGGARKDNGTIVNTSSQQQRIASEAVSSVEPAPDSHLSSIKESIEKITMAIADTKRVTFSDQMLQEIDTDLQETQILVLSSTRDMALYVDSVLSVRCEPLDITCYACVGGTIILNDKKNLAAGPHIVSGTPGRVCDMIRRRVLRTKHIKMLVLNKEEELLRRTMHEQLADVHRLLEPDTTIARASVRVVGELADLVKRFAGGLNGTPGAL